MGRGGRQGSGLECGLWPFLQVICSSGDNRKSQGPGVPSQLLIPAQGPWVWSLRVWVLGSLVALDGQAGAGRGPEAQSPCPFQNARGCPAGHR